MSKRMSLRRLAAAASVALVALAAAPERERAVTRADFTVRLARALGYPAQDGAAARQDLGAFGIDLGPGGDLPLTRAQAADLMRGLGVPATVSDDPNAPLTSQAATVAAQMTAAAIAERATSPGTESLPDGCSSAIDRTQCMQCCTAALSHLPSRSPISVVTLCTLICTAVGAPPVSPGAPN